MFPSLLESHYLVDFAIIFLFSLSHLLEGSTSFDLEGRLGVSTICLLQGCQPLPPALATLPPSGARLH